MQSKVKFNPKDNKNKRNIIIVIILFVVCSLSLTVFLYMLNTNPSNETIMKHLEKIIVLPSDEKPTITEIIDATGLEQESPFYSNVENGDRLIIYIKNSKIIIYRPKENKIINVGPIINDIDSLRSQN